jgi:hypothetical protein
VSSVLSSAGADCVMGTLNGLPVPYPPWWAGPGAAMAASEAGVGVRNGAAGGDTMTAKSLVPSTALEHWLDALAATLQAGRLVSHPSPVTWLKELLLSKISQCGRLRIHLLQRLNSPGNRIDCSCIPCQRQVAYLAGVGMARAQP